MCVSVCVHYNWGHWCQCYKFTDKYKYWRPRKLPSRNILLCPLVLINWTLPFTNGHLAAIIRCLQNILPQLIGQKIQSHWQFISQCLGHVPLTTFAIWPYHLYYTQRRVFYYQQLPEMRTLVSSHTHLLHTMKSMINALTLRACYIRWILNRHWS